MAFDGITLNAVVNELIKNHDYKQVVTTTTRPMRKGEQQDVTYHFISDDEFKQKIKEGYFAEYKSYNTKFGTWDYGSASEDLENADDKSVIILTPQGYRDAKDKLSKKNITCVYLYADNTTLKKRLIKRGDDPEVIKKRLLLDGEVFNKDVMKLADWVIDTSASNIYDNALEIYLLYKDNI